MKETKEYCDRCHKEIKRHVHIMRINKISTIWYGIGAYDYINCNFILCRECSKGFDKFMGGRNET